MKKYIFLLIFAGLVGSLHAQQALTLYNMDRVMQSQFVNPAIDVPYKLHIGGVLVPVAGQLPPPIYVNYANNGFYWNHLYHKDEFDPADTLYVLDLPLFMERMESFHRTTHMRCETQLELLNVGIRLENMFLTFALTEKFRYGLSLPYDLFEFSFNGNMPYMLEGKPLDFSGLGINFTHYREFAVGGSMKANDELTVGARLKILFGLANFNTEIKELSLYTDPEDYSMTFQTDMKIHSSLPVYYDYMFYQVEGPDSVKLELNEESVNAFLPDTNMTVESATKYLMNMKNIGLGFDLGVNYKFSPQIDFFASVTDFGFITWNTNPQNLVSKGEYEFRGIQMEIWEDDADMNESLDKFVDTVLNTFKFDLLETSYVTWLPTSFYAGGKYKFHDLLHFTALYRGEFYRKSYIQSLTLGVNSNLTNWLSAHLTWSLANNTVNNLGFGLSARMGFMSWYFITDGLTNLIFPQKARNLNLRVGCNLVFGYKKIKSNASIRT